jgi:hypothetical protein
MTTMMKGDPGCRERGGANEVLAQPKRRKFTSEYKLRIVREAEKCRGASAIGELHLAYRVERGPRSKHRLAAALAASAGQQHLGDLIALAKDKRHGESRVLLLHALERSRIPERREVERLHHDAELQREIDAISARDERRLRRRLARESGRHAAGRQREAGCARAPPGSRTGAGSCSREPSCPRRRGREVYRPPLLLAIPLYPR